MAAVVGNRKSTTAPRDDGLTTMHAVSVRGTWRWTLPAADLAAYEQGTCPTS